MNRFLWLKLGAICLLVALILNVIATAFLGGQDHSTAQLGWLFVANLVCSAGSGLAVLMVYLRANSGEAKQIIQTMRAGDPGARFDVGRLDEMGGWKADFNAMIDQVDALADRIKIAEATRRDLLQELNHHLRTPLTSLTTTIDTLHQYHVKMSHEQQQESLNIALREMNYFLRLLEDMTFIAELPEPGQVNAGEMVRLHELCDDLIQSRENAQPQVHWFLQDKTGHDANIEGSAYLLLRLLRNVLDNAARFANYQISITLNADSQWVYLTIEDDGPGMDLQTIELFGKRRKQRMHQERGSAGLSLGLGSVMISAITRLHGGKLDISNRHDTAASSTGAVLHFTFPRYRRAAS